MLPMEEGVVQPKTSPACQTETAAEEMWLAAADVPHGNKADA